MTTTCDSLGLGLHGHLRDGAEWVVEGCQVTLEVMSVTTVASDGLTLSVNTSHNLGPNLHQAAFCHCYASQD